MDQWVKMLVGVTVVHDELTPVVDKGLTHFKAGMRVVIMESTDRKSDIIVGDLRHFDVDDAHTTNMKILVSDGTVVAFSIGI